MVGLSAIQKLIFRRRDCYRRIFLDMQGRPTPDAEVVLADLRRFCCANKPTIRLTAANEIDPYAMAVAEGRREVWNRLQAQLYLDDKTITNLIEQE